MLKDESILSEGCMGVAEVAAVLNLSKTTVYRLLDSGELPHVKIGSIRRVPVKALSEYASGHLVRGRLPESE